MSISIEQLPIIETSFICDCCGGTGKDPLTRDQMKNFIKNMPLWMAKEFVKEWRENEERLLCAECHGEGGGIHYY